MKFTVSSKELYATASAASRVIAPKNAITILDNFLINLSGDVLTITGADQENTIQARLKVDVAEGAGSVCLPARRLVDLLKELPDQGVTMIIDENTLEAELDYTSGHYSFVGISADQYPSYSAPQSEENISFTIAAEQMLAGLDNTMFAVSEDEYRMIMQGVLMDVAPESITFVATDTRKLVRYVDRRTAPGVEGRCVIPGKPANVIKSVFSAQEELHITMNRRNAVFSSERLSFTCTFLNGNYPDYNRVFPKSNIYVLEVDRVALLNAVRRCAIFVDGAGGLEKFRITPESLLIKSGDPSLCTSAREKLTCSYSGNELVIGFAANYLIEILSKLKGQQVVINLGDAARPGVFTPSEQVENTELTMLLMPMTVTDF